MTESPQITYTGSEVIDALYRAVLNRKPDEHGLYSFGKILQSGPEGLNQVADFMFNSHEHANLLKLTSGIDHSQFGEFSIMLRWFVEFGSQHKMIVDVGARGKDRSNSFDFLEKFGWRGILVEANPRLYESIEKDFIGLDFELVKCAVDVKAGVMPFYIGTNDDVSSLIEAQAAEWGDLRGVISVPVRTLASLLVERQVPLDFDILSLDIEGLDVPVFNSFIETTQYRPRMVLIEASFDFRTETLAGAGLNTHVINCYEIIDRTRANLILGLKSCLAGRVTKRAISTSE